MTKLISQPAYYSTTNTMLEGTHGKVSTPSKLELKPLVDLVAVCGGGPPDVAMPHHRVSVPAVQRQHPHRAKRARQEWQRRYVQAVYNQATGLDSLHLNRRKAVGENGRREHVIEPLDGNTRLTAILDFYSDSFPIGPDSAGDDVYYSSVPEQEAGRAMSLEEREWLDGRELPIIWYDNVTPRVAAGVFVGLNRYKSPIRPHEIASALIHGSDNTALAELREASRKALSDIVAHGMSPRGVRRNVVEACVARDIQTFTSFCACIAHAVLGLDEGPATETPEFVDALSLDAFQPEPVIAYHHVAAALPSIVLAVTSVWDDVFMHRIPLGTDDRGNLSFSRQIKRGSMLVIAHATLNLGSTSKAICSRFASLRGAPVTHPWFAAVKDMRTRRDVVAAAATLNLEADHEV